MAIRQNKVTRLYTDLLSRPHLITPQAFNSITSYLDKRNAGSLMKIEDVDETPDDIDDFSPEIGIGIIEVCGALTNHPVETMCGVVGTSYKGILGSVDEMIEEGAKTIVLNVSSSGGEAFNCMASADELRKRCDVAGVELLAYVNECAASAAYAITCVADKVFCHPMGEVGSIGVLIAMIDSSKAMDMAGYKRVFVSAGAEKIPYAEDGSFKDTFIESLQERVDDLYENFCAHVSKYTGLSVEFIKSTEAACFTAPKALELGLINEIMTNEQFVAFLATKINTQTEMEQE